MRTRLLLLCLAVLGASTTAFAQEDYHVELGATWWKPASPEIVASSGQLSTSVDFINQFAVADKRFTSYKLTLKAGRKHKLRFGQTPIEYSGSATLTQRITFRGQTFNVGVPTTASVKWTLQQFGYEYDPIATAAGYVGVFADVKYNKLDASLATAARTESFAQNVPIPTLGGTARAYVSRNASVTAEFTAFKWNRSNINGKVYDFDIYGTAHLGRNLGAQVGYRRLTADFTVDNDAGNMKLKGPYFGGVLRF
jgi:hypothetical protein